MPRATSCWSGCAAAGEKRDFTSKLAGTDGGHERLFLAGRAHGFYFAAEHHEKRQLGGCLLDQEFALLNRAFTPPGSNARDLRRSIDQVLANNRNLDQTLKRHGHGLYDARKRIHIVSKSLEKRP